MTVGSVPEVPEGQTAPAAAPSRGGRWVWIVAAIAAALVVAVGATVVVLIVGASGPAEQFEATSKAFHTSLTERQNDLQDKLRISGAGLFDPAFGAAKDEARSIGDLFEQYGKDIRAIVIPDTARAACDRVLRVIAAGQLVVVNVAGAFQKSEMQSLLDNFWPKVSAELTKAEETLRVALNE